MPDKDQREEGERRGGRRGGGADHRRTSQVGRERESGKSLVFDLQQERWSDEDEEGLRERNSTSGKRRDTAHDGWGESSPSLATRRSPVGHPTPGSLGRFHRRRRRATFSGRMRRREKVRTPSGPQGRVGKENVRRLPPPPPPPLPPLPPFAGCTGWCALGCTDTQYTWVQHWIVSRPNSLSLPIQSLAPGRELIAPLRKHRPG